jgi:replication factor C subunit 3/5
LLLARGKVYELLTNCIPPDVIMRAIVRSLLRRVDDELRHEVVHWAAYYEHRMRLGSKPVFHIEAFLAKFMALYKAWIATNFGG